MTLAARRRGVTSAADPLTGLPGRSVFSGWLADHLGREPLVVAALDIDGFAGVNIEYGHPAGDVVLIELADRLRRVAYSGLTARIGADAFMVAVPLAEVHDAAEFARRVCTAAARPVGIDDVEIRVTVSVGTVTTEPGLDPEALERHLERALERARRSGVGAIVVGDTVPAVDSDPRAITAVDLHRALDAGELAVHYLPVVSLASAEVVGVEALVRWERGADEIVAAGRFIDLAERTGLIVPIGRWALDRSCEAVARWNEEHPDQPLRLTVNVSARELVHPDLVDHVRGVLDATGLQGNDLSLDIGEATLADRADLATGVLESLAELDVRIAVDDVGTASSSLVALQGFPLDELKIDRAFVARMDEDGAAAALVRTIVVLARSLGMQAVAEGVERRSQEQMLRGMRCDAAQGWLYGRPGPDLAAVVAGAAAALRDSVQRAPSDEGELWAELPGPGAAAHLAEAVFERAPIGMAVIDGTGSYLVANQALGQLLGTDPGQLVGRSCWDTVHPDDLRHELVAMDTLLRGEVVTYALEQRHLALDGSVRWVEVTVGPVPGETGANGSLRLLRQVRSIEERRRAEQAVRDANRALEARAKELAEANERLAGFATTLTHDLMQPMSALAGFLVLIDRDAQGLSEEERTWLAAALRSKDRLVSAVQALHRHATESDVHLVPVDLGTVVAEVLAGYEKELADATVEVRALPIVLGDAAMLAQVVANLVANACRYRDEERQLVVRIDAVREGRRWSLRVTDNGRGLQDDEADRIFEPAHRGSASDGTDGSGTGLATVRSIMGRLRGEIYAERRSRGARFVASLPAAD